MLQINVTSQDAALLVFINLGWLMAAEGSHAEEGSGGGEEGSSATCFKESVRLRGVDTLASGARF